MPGAGNTIAFNGNDGVFIETGTGNAIQQNSILASGRLGIELRSNGNNNQPAPTLASATSDGTTTTIVGSVHASADTTFTLEFFANSVPNASGAGEGEQFLGSCVVTTDDAGDANFTATLQVPVAAGEWASATATDADNNTSAFAQCVSISDPVSHAWAVAGAQRPDSTIPTTA